MSIRLYTETELDELRSMPKQVENPRARWSVKPKARPVHRQRSYHVTARDERSMRFLIYLRQSLAYESDVSCGISFVPRGAPPLTLARYNGSSHVHGDIAFRPHVHRASQAAIAAGRRAESNAEETSQYSSLEGALACLLADFAVVGLSARMDQPRLFDGY